MTDHSGRVWGKTPVQSVLIHYCQLTIVGGASVRVTSHRQTARFEKEVKILVDKKKHWVDFYHYRIVYTHCQQTFQFKQLVKVHVALYDPFHIWTDVIAIFFLGAKLPRIVYDVSRLNPCPDRICKPFSHFLCWFWGVICEKGVKHSKMCSLKLYYTLVGSWKHNQIN